MSTAINTWSIDDRPREKLLQKGVIVRPMGAWSLKTFIRVTIGKPAENKRFISGLKPILKRS